MMYVHIGTRALRTGADDELYMILSSGSATRFLQHMATPCMHDQ